MDLQFDVIFDGRRLKYLKLINEHSRLRLVPRVGCRCTTNVVVAMLKEVTNHYPATLLFHSDNGT